MASNFKKLFRWEIGRQESGYEKMLLATALWPIPFDMYLLRFREGQEILPHVDQVTAGRHYRLNIVLTHADEGGEFICKSPIYETNRIKFFRPDITEHQVTKIVSGSRYVFSLGWLRNT